MTITAEPITAKASSDAVQHVTQHDPEAVTTSGDAADHGTEHLTEHVTAALPSDLTAAGPVPIGVVIGVDPNEVLADSNVRDGLALDDDFIASIKENGVLVPATCVLTGQGRIRIRFGHRRHQAAIETGRTLPVVVVADERVDSAAQIERIIGQFVENEHRTGLTMAEKVGVAEQLELLGVSATRIARRTRMPRKQVAAALAVAKSTAARNAAGLHEHLDLNQLAAVAEFDGDDAVVSTLITAARRGDFAHQLQRARDERADAAQRAAAEAWLAERGITVITEAHSADRSVRKLHELTADPATREAITEAEHAACPGHAALLKVQWRTYSVPDTDDEDTQDGEAAQDPANDWTVQPWAARWRVEPVCTDHAAHGHDLRHVYTSTDSAPKVKAADLPPAEREARAAERRELIANNKAWESATTVRHEALANLARRVRAPKGTIAFLAATMAHDSGILNDIKANHMAADVLDSKAGGGGYGRSHAIQNLLTKANEARAQVIHLVMVLTAYEARASREHWRTHDTTTARYLTFLATTGYKLSDVEQRATTRPTNDQNPAQPQDDSAPAADLVPANTDQAADTSEPDHTDPTSLDPGATDPAPDNPAATEDTAPDTTTGTDDTDSQNQPDVEHGDQDKTSTAQPDPDQGAADQAAPNTAARTSTRPRRSTTKTRTKAAAAA